MAQECSLGVRFWPTGRIHRRDEKIPQIRARGSGVKIDLQVDPMKLRDDDFLKCLMSVFYELSKEKTIKNLCLHEAAHLYFLDQICKIVGSDISKLEFVGPTISYNEVFLIDGKGQYEYCLAAVRAPFFEGPGIQYTEEIQSLFALAAVAGGVFLRELQGEGHGGDDQDKRQFLKHYLKATNEQGLRPPDFDEMLQTARQRVSAMLKTDPLFESKVRRRADDLEIKYFSNNSVY